MEKKTPTIRTLYTNRTGNEIYDEEPLIKVPDTQTLDSSSPKERVEPQ